MKTNVRYVDIKFLEEDLDSMISEIKSISIISLTDEGNNVSVKFKKIFIVVR